MKQNCCLLVGLIGATGCVHSYGVSSTGVTSLPGRTAVLAGATLRTDLRMPREYTSYFGTELFGGTQVWESNSAVHKEDAGRGQPAVHLAATYGWLRVPDATERWGWRLGAKGGVWHGAMGDRDNRWSLDLGLEAATFIRLGPRLKPWQSDETISLSPFIVPALSAAPLVRLGSVEESHWAMTYSATVSFGFLFSSTVVP